MKNSTMIGKETANKINWKFVLNNVNQVSNKKD